MADAQSGLALVHLALREYGLECFADFVASYRAHPAGTAHELVIAAKQFGTDEAFAEWRQLLEGIPHRLIHVPDEGFDLGTYFHLARATDYDRFCFVNSRSVILAPGWLGFLSAALDRIPGGVAAATGSWESISSDACLRDYPAWPRALQWLRRWLGYLKLLPGFPGFPNPHVRTNCFAVSRATMLSLKFPAIRNKRDAWRFESGRHGFTRQIIGTGAAAVLVDTDGQAYPVADWAVSGTFWQGEQARLLVADNQTRMYRDADPATRRQLRRAAWNSE